MIIRRFENEEQKKQIINHLATSWDVSKGFFTTPHMQKNYFYPLMDPRCVPAKEATHMRDTDYVVGIYHKGKARAYPQFITDYPHQINDVIEGDPFVFCG